MKEIIELSYEEIETIIELIYDDMKEHMHFYEATGRVGMIISLKNKFRELCIETSKKEKIKIEIKGEK